MTEEKWHNARDPRSLLSHLKTASKRKLRLFGCACCRYVWHFITDESCKKAVEAAEMWADKIIDTRSLHAVQIQAREAQDHITSRPGKAFDVLSEAAMAASHIALPNKAWVASVANNVRAAMSESQGRTGLIAAESYQIALLRDIFGNPFRPVAFDPNWRTTTALALARGIYEERAFDRLPILADALQDAGCDNDDILTHLRDTTTPHVRGCWALDLVLGKS
jgi:hypothetical protein